MLRLRQIVYVARDLDAAVDSLGGVLGADVVYRDPGVAEFGLNNALFCVGDQFVEIVSPFADHTTAGRLLDKRGGDGGYMVMLQTDDLAALEAGFEREGLRVIFDARHSVGDDLSIRGLHLHPKDVGAAILSIDEAHPASSWIWAGTEWSTTTPATQVRAVTGVIIQAEQPFEMATRWARATGRSAEVTDSGASIVLDDATLYFVPLADERGEGVAGYCFAPSPGVMAQSTMVLGARFVVDEAASAS
ncbi:MAG: VOC family protein [Acidimicrobiales bacterium]